MDNAPRPVQQFYNNVKKLLNKYSSAVWFHPKSMDNESMACGGCKYHHWHLLFIPEITLTNDSTWKSVRQSAKQVNVNIILQNVTNPIRLCAHFHVKPRMFFGVKDLAMAEFVIKGYHQMQKRLTDLETGDVTNENLGEEDTLPSDDSIWGELGFKIQKQKDVSTSPAEGVSLLDMFDAPSTSTAPPEKPWPLKRSSVDAHLDEDNWADYKHKKLTVVGKRIKDISELFKKYNCKDLLTLLQVSKDNNDDYHMAYCSFTAHNQKQIEDKAAQLAATVDEPEFLIDLFLNHPLPTTISTGHSYLTVEKTRDLFLDWCREQAIVEGQFLLEYYMVLTGLAGKKNAMILQGQSNAGKTLWLDAMLYMRDLVGYATKSENFAFQSLPNARIARCDEIQLTQTNVDEWKRLLSGEEFYVQVKNQGDKKISALPVFGSCNNTFVQFLTHQDAQAITNRVFLYSNLTESTVLSENYDAEEGRKPNPNFFKNCLREMHSFPVSRLIDTYTYMVEEGTSPDVEWVVKQILQL